MAHFCTKCGNRLEEGVKFCTKCGTPVPEGWVTRSQPQTVPEPPDPTKISIEDKKVSFRAFTSSAEQALGVISEKGGASAVIPGTGEAVISGIKSFFTSAGSAFKDPKKLIPAIVLAVLWLILNILKACGIDILPTRVLSFLTFANGGLSGGIAGAIGGIIGKGIFAGAVASLINLIVNRNKGEKRSFGETVKGAFGISPDTLWPYLTGAGAAMFIYLFISGGATKMSFMAGIAASFLSARAALKNGFLKKFLGSFASKGKESAGPGAEGLIRGLAAGFAASSLMCFTNSVLPYVIIGSILLTGGGVMMILQATGVVNMGKGANGR